MLVKNALKRLRRWGWEAEWLELTGFSVHFIRRELERRDTKEYKSYK